MSDEHQRVVDAFLAAARSGEVMIDGDIGAAWIAASELKVAFVFHVEAGRVQEVELLADPEILATVAVERVRRSG